MENDPVALRQPVDHPMEVERRGGEAVQDEDRHGVAGAGVDIEQPPAENTNLVAAGAPGGDLTAGRFPGHSALAVGVCTNPRGGGVGMMLPVKRQAERRRLRAVIAIDGGALVSP